MFHSCSFNISVNLTDRLPPFVCDLDQIRIGSHHSTFNLRIQRLHLRRFAWIFRRFGRRKSKTSNWFDFRGQRSRLAVIPLIPYLWTLHQNSKLRSKMRSKEHLIMPIKTRSKGHLMLNNQRARSLKQTTNSQDATGRNCLKLHWN